MNDLEELLGRLGGALDDGQDELSRRAAGQAARASLSDAIDAERSNGHRGRWRQGVPRPGGHGRWLGVFATGLSVLVVLVVLAIALGSGIERRSTGLRPFASSLSPFYGPTGMIGPSVPRKDRVVAPITVRALPGDGPFCGNDQGGPFYVCKPGEIPLAGTTPLIVLHIAFTARAAARSPKSRYYAVVKNPGNCGGSGKEVNRNVDAGTRVTMQLELQTRCRGTFDGIVEYLPNTGSKGANRPLFFREPGAQPVGTFTYQLAKLPGPSTSIPDGRLHGTLTLCCNASGSTREAGTIVVSGADNTRRYTYPGRSGRFSVSLPPGHYRVLGGIPKLGWSLGRCHPIPALGSVPATVTVRSGQTTTVTVRCQGQ